jgi:hypothetical protein
MLDRTRIEKGMHVYRLEWVDLPHVKESVPLIREAVVVEWGSQFGAVRELSLRDGRQQGKDRRRIDYLCARFSATRHSALVYEKRAAEKNIEYYKAKIKDAQRTLKILNKEVAISDPFV